MVKRPTTEDEEALELLSKRDDLTPWENDFVESLSECDPWSKKQGEVFDEVFERHF